MLYQVHSLIRTVDDASRSGSSISREAIYAQIDALILSVIDALEGEQETEIVRCMPPRPAAPACRSISRGTSSTQRAGGAAQRRGQHREQLLLREDDGDAENPGLSRAGQACPGTALGQVELLTEVVDRANGGWMRGVLRAG